ncbi:MltA domain-containing protein [Ancylothrix sp. C2]|uniref:murein transglycosylase A n=1 Tax=Ancylothrix sp. D3o TaxID=2953691 RepID=UPI0021BB48E9|nr:MltA domain-containing protein [Ancylothrix sp. D3o]MCT7949032.1 MltA domain-containing protein [Ancylothrix sp. D3o]
MLKLALAIGGMALVIPPSGWVALSAIPTQPVIAQNFLAQNFLAQNFLAQNLEPAETLGFDDQLWGNDTTPADRQALLEAIDYSLQYLQTPAAAKAYQQYPSGITRQKIQQSLLRFRELLQELNSPQELQAAVQREFTLYQPAGNNTVFVTGYYTPFFAASRTPNDLYRYPLYRRPPDFGNWPKPHPTRAALEGTDGTGGRLSGLELVWLRDRLEAFFVHIQGSAYLQLTDGTRMAVGFAGATDYPFTSISRELAKDGKLRLDGLNIPVLTNYFRSNPGELSNYLPRNNRFIFFSEKASPRPTGALQLPVTSERSIATDKALMPAGGLALIHTKLPIINEYGQVEQRLVTRYVLDQDAGSAIKGPDRVDYYQGIGPQASARAGVTGSRGRLYYLLLK